MKKRNIYIIYQNIYEKLKKKKNNCEIQSRMKIKSIKFYINIFTKKSNIYIYIVPPTLFKNKFCLLMISCKFYAKKYIIYIISNFKYFQNFIGTGLPTLAILHKSCELPS